MRSLRFIGVTALFLIVLTGNAWAVGKCRVGCTVQYRTCTYRGLWTRLACLDVCRANRGSLGLGFGPCVRDCALTFSGARRQCFGDSRNCGTSCAPEPNLDEACLENCGTQLTTCEQGVLSVGLPCVNGCRTAADPVTCLQGCVAVADAAGDMCGSDFTACLSTCPISAP